MIDCKFLSFEAGGQIQAGLLVAGNVHALAALTGRPSDSSILSVLSDWPASLNRAVAAAQALGDGAGGLPLDQVRLTAPVLYPSAIYCAGANYRDHVREMSRAAGRAEGPDPRSIGLRPWHFLKPSRCVVGDLEAVALPAASKAVDWEVELAAVIGRPARNVSVDTALDYVAGYTIANDLSARDLSRRPPTPETSPFFFDWLAHKGFEGACPLGPWITPAALIADPQDLKIGLSVNGVAKQDSNTSEMIFSIAEQIAQLSSLRTLHPGDVVLTGTPAGVGAARREFLQPGDLLEAWIEGIGALRTPIEAPLPVKS